MDTPQTTEDTEARSARLQEALCSMLCDMRTEEIAEWIAELLTPEEANSILADYDEDMEA